MPDANSVSLSSIFFFFVCVSLSALHFLSFWILVAFEIQIHYDWTNGIAYMMASSAGRERERWCRHSGCFCRGRLSTCLLPEPNMWFNPQGTGWHFLNVSVAFCTCLHSSTRHGGEGAPLVETSKPWYVCSSYARNWHHLTPRKTDKKVIFVEFDLCCLRDEAPTLECKVLNATHRPWICTLIGQ